MKVPQQSNQQGDTPKLGQLLSFAWDLGYMIAIPIVVFAIGGAWLDGQFETSPWLLLSGIFLAMLVTGLWIRAKIDLLLTKAQTETKTKQ